MTPFSLYSQYYDLLYADKPTEAECAYVTGLLRRFEVPGNTWLEWGAGSGRHGQVFQQAGICWTGVEQSGAMAAKGLEKGLDIRIGTMQSLSLLPQQYDAVLALFHVMSYLNTDEELEAAFENAHRHLRTGGLFVFDVWYTPAVCRQLPEERVKEMQNTSIRVQRRATPQIDWHSHTVNVHYDIEVEAVHDGTRSHFSEDHRMRHFGLPELRRCGKQAGFSMLYAGEWLSEQPPGTDTWGVCVVFKKNT